MGITTRATSLAEWWASGQRVQFELQQGYDSTHPRTERVSCHLINDLAEEGNDDCITFLHGYPTSSFDYLPVVRLLLQAKQGTHQISAKLLLVDFLGYGDSDKGVGEARFTIEEQANAVEAVWHKLGIKQSHLVVHGFACSVAQELLCRQPKSRLSVRLMKIFMTNGSLFMDMTKTTAQTHLPGMLKGRMTGWLGARLLSAVDFWGGLKRLFSKAHPPTQQILDNAYESLRHRDGLKIHHKLVRSIVKDRARYKHVWQGALTLAVRQDARRFLFCWGMQDPSSGPPMVQELHKRYDEYGIRIIELPDVGHWPHIEDPNKVAAVLIDFLTEMWVPSAALMHCLPSESSTQTPLPRVSGQFACTVMHGILQSERCSSMRRKRTSIERIATLECNVEEQAQ